MANWALNIYCVAWGLTCEVWQATTHFIGPFGRNWWRSRYR